MLGRRVLRSNHPSSIAQEIYALLCPPARRLRVSPRAVKRPLSRYAYKSLRVDRRTYKAAIKISILTRSPDP